MATLIYLHTTTATPNGATLWLVLATLAFAWYASNPNTKEDTHV